MTWLGVNLLMLPIVGRLLMLNKQLDREMRDRERGPSDRRIMTRPDQPARRDDAFESLAIRLGDTHSSDG